MTKKQIIKLLTKASKKTFSNQTAINKQIQKIATLQTAIQKKGNALGTEYLCQKCQGRCCSNIILECIAASPELAYFVAKMNPDFQELIKNNRPAKNKCALLGPRGCLLKPNGRPRICINYFCYSEHKKKTAELRNKHTRAFWELKKYLKKSP